MAGIPKFSGFINSVFAEKDRYSFYFDGKKLNLNLLDHSGLMIGQDKQEPFLLANHSAGGAIGLYRCVCSNNPFDDTATIFPSMIYMPRNINSLEKKFDRLLFKGKIVNQLFPPTQKVEYDSARDFRKEFDGSKMITLKSFDATDVSFTATINGDLLNCRFGIYWPGSINQKDDNLGELISYFEISFTEQKHIEEILPLYFAVRKFFQFLAKRQDVYFDEIQVSRKNEKGKFEQIGYFFDNTAELSDIKIKSTVISLLPHIGSLFSKIVENKLNYNFIAKNSFEAKYITPEGYLKVCGAFEHNYEHIFTESAESDTYKLETIDFIKRILDEKFETEALSKKYKRYYSHIIDVLNKDVNSVETQYNRCLKYYKSTIREYLDKIMTKYSLTKETTLGEAFASFRNDDAHGDLIKFTPTSACSYLICLVLIECMILQEAGYSLKEIGTIIKERYIY